jgi:hypothetical protein
LYKLYVLLLKQKKLSLLDITGFSTFTTLLMRKKKPLYSIRVAPFVSSVLYLILIWFKQSYLHNYVSNKQNIYQQTNVTKYVAFSPSISISNVVHGEVYSIQHNVIKFVSDFLRVLRFLHRPPRHNWNSVESDFKHHNPNSDHINNHHYTLLYFV